MRTFVGIVAAAALLAAAIASPSVTRASIIVPYSMAGSQAVVDGVTHEWGSSGSEFIPGSTEENPTPEPEYATQHVNILRVDAQAPDVHFETSLPAGNGAIPTGQVNSLQRTSYQALRETRPGHRVVAAINGDFWRTDSSGETADRRSPVDFNVRNGELIAAQSGKRGAIGFMADGAPIIGQPEVGLSITLPDTTVLPVAALNQIRDPNEVILYTPTFGRSTATTQLGVEVVLSGVTLPLPLAGTFTGTVVTVGTDVMSTPIPTDSVILSTTGTYASALSTLVAGNNVQLDVSVEAPWQDVVNAVGGIRILVHEGVAATDFSTPSELVRDARMSAGFDANGNVMLVTVGFKRDGTDGLTQADMAQLMASLGAVEAINLDGGGSATMVVDPAGDAPLAVVNEPLEGFERRVNTTLQIVSTAVEPEPVVPTVTAPVVRFTPGTTAGKDDAAVEVSWQAADADGVVTSTELQRFDSGVWQPVDLATPTSSAIFRRPRFSRDLQYRVRVTDDDGNTSPWSVGKIYRIGAVNERATAIVRTGKWPVVDRSSAIGGKFGRNSAKTQPGQAVTLSYSAIQVAWIGPRSDLAGTAQVHLDGQSAGTVSVTRYKPLARAVLFVGPALDETAVTVVPSRTIKITNTSTRARPYVDLDAFLVLTAR